MSGLSRSLRWWVSILLLSLAAAPAASQTIRVRELWSLDQAELGSRASVLASDPLDGAFMVGLESGRLCALEPDSGELRWCGQLAAPPRLLRSSEAGLWVVSGEPSSPQLQLWRESGPVWERALGAAVRQLTLGPDLLLLSLEPQTLLALVPETGSLLWEQTTTQPLRSPPLVSGKLVYVGTETGVEARELEQGQLLWHRELGAAVAGRPCVNAGRLFVASEDDTVHGLDAASGQPHWQLDIGAPARAGLLPYANGVLVASLANQLLALRPNGHSYWRVPLPGRVVNTPEQWQGQLLLLPLRSPRLYLHDWAGGRRLSDFGLRDWQEWVAAPPATAGDRLLVLTSRGRLLGMGARGAEPEPQPSPTPAEGAGPAAEPQPSPTPADGAEPAAEPQSPTAAPLP